MEWKTVNKTNNKKNLHKSKNNNSNENLSQAANSPIIQYNKIHYDLVKNYVDNKIKVLVILRGCSGSGKSTLAK